MTKHIDRQEYLPGCMWSVLHILDYHYWHTSKKRKHRRGKHTICCGYPKTISFQHYADEAHDYLDADAVPLIDEQKTMDARPTDRNSAKARIKAVIAKEMSARSQMQQTGSFHRLKSSDSLGGLTSDWSNPIIILDKTADAAESRLQIPSLDTSDKLVNESLKSSSDSTKLSREISDVLEIFKINKNMFLEILQDPDVQAANNSKSRLKKSGSFPLASSPDNNRHLKPSTLEHKSRETWSFPKGENFNSDVKVSETTESKSLEDFLQMPKGIQANDTVVLAVSEESSFSTSTLSQGSIKHRRHHSFVGQLKCMMKKIKHGIKDSKRQNSQTSRDSPLHRVSSLSSLPTAEKYVSGTLEDVAIQQAGSESSSSMDFSRSRLSHMRRVSSLNDSMDRYARLFEYGLTRESKWHQQKSKSLRLTTEDKIPESGYTIKSFKRRLSLQESDSDSFYPLPNETTREAVQSEIPIKNTEHFGLQDAVTESELHNMVEEGRYEQNECPADFGSRVSFGGELEEHSHVSVLESRIEDLITAQTNFQDLKGSELDCRHNSTVNLQDMSSKPPPKIENHFLYSEIEAAEDADFDYVKDVLEVSGLIQQGYLGSWHSLDQPLSPTLFKELEIYLHHELESSSDDACNHQLLFDSINEALLHMYASSLAYFPKNFSFAQRVLPLPKGDRIIEEVWKRIGWYRSPKAKIEQSLDDIVARDLAKDESWSELQLDLEDIALDLEEWIFDELIDETMCSFHLAISL